MFGVRGEDGECFVFSAGELAAPLTIEIAEPLHNGTVARVSLEVPRVVQHLLDVLPALISVNLNKYRGDVVYYDAWVNRFEEDAG